MNKCPTVESGLAGKAESCKGCPNANICLSAKPDEDIPIIKNNLSNFKYIIAILSGKGGVGKSTISKNIAENLSLKGFKTLLVDLDLSGPSIPRLTNTLDEIIINPNTTFDPVKINDNFSVISMGHLESFEDLGKSFNSNIKTHIIKKIFKNCNFLNFDIMIIDTPPNITDEHLGLVNYVKPNGAIMVTTPQKISFDDVIRQITFCNKASIEILGLIENMKNFSCTKCKNKIDIFPDSDIQNYCKNEKLNYLGSLELNPVISKSSDNGESFKNEFFENLAEYLIKKIAEK